MDVTILALLVALAVGFIIASGVWRDETLLVIPAVMLMMIGALILTGDVTKTVPLSNTTTTVVLDVPRKSLWGLLFILFGAFLFYSAVPERGYKWG